MGLSQQFDDRALDATIAEQAHRCQTRRLKVLTEFITARSAITGHVFGEEGIALNDAFMAACRAVERIASNTSVAGQTIRE